MEYEGFQLLTEGLQPLTQQPCCAVSSEVNLSTPKAQHISDRPSHSTACCPCPLLRPVGMWNMDSITICVLPPSSSLCPGYHRVRDKSSRPGSVSRTKACEMQIFRVTELSKQQWGQV